MAERSFAREVQDLKLGEGEEFRGEGILAITKALLQSGVSYVGGYQGAPISHLMDVLADAKDVLDDLGVHFENSASEAAAAATLAASVMYPIRGAVTFKAPVGINVASDAIANLASGGVKGGALIIIGEDYGEGSSIMQERSHPFAMKSQVWLLDPRPNLPTIVKMVEEGFELSEASNTPVMLEVRIRACHVHGRFICKDNKKPSFSLREALENPRRDTERVVLPPASYLHEREKIEHRWPAAVKFIKDRRLNEFFGPESADVGIVVQGGMYNSVMRALQQLGLADVYGETSVPIYCLNVTYPLIDDEVAAFAMNKKAILMVEEGQPEFIEQALNTILRRRDIQTKISGKDVLPMAGEYTPQVVVKGVKAFLELYAKNVLGNAPPPPDASEVLANPKIKELAKTVPPRPPSFCIGCPERPIFAAMKLVQQELGPHQIAGDIGCHLFASLPPFNIGGTTMGYGLGPASSSAFNVKADKKPISVMGDGGFWHNGLSTSIANAVYNKHDGVIMVVDNFYSAATVALDQQHHRRCGEGRRRQMGAPHRPHLRRGQDARDVARGAHHQGRRSESHRGVVRMHAQQAAPGEAVVPEIGARRRAHGARALRRRRGCLHRRSRLHPAFRLSVALAQAHRRSAQGRSGGGDRQQLRRLRQLRRGVGSRRALPFLLSRRHHPQSDLVRSLHGRSAAFGDHLPAAAARGDAHRFRRLMRTARS